MAKQKYKYKTLHIMSINEYINKVNYWKYLNTVNYWKYNVKNHTNTLYA